MKAIKYQLVKVTVPAAGQTVNINTNTDKLYKRVTGIFASLSCPFSFAGTSLSLNINDKEIFPENFEIMMVSCGMDVSPNERFYNLDEEAEGSTVRGKYTDGNLNPMATFPYTAYLYLRLENKD
jgi:hypothetical protein